LKKYQQKLNGADEEKAVQPKEICYTSPSSFGIARIYWNPASLAFSLSDSKNFAFL